jgi:hypothetical protein
MQTEGWNVSGRIVEYLHCTYSPMLEWTQLATAKKTKIHYFIGPCCLHSVTGHLVIDAKECLTRARKMHALHVRKCFDTVSN